MLIDEKVLAWIHAGAIKDIPHWQRAQCRALRCLARCPGMSKNPCMCKAFHGADLSVWKFGRWHLLPSTWHWSSTSQPSCARRAYELICFRVSQSFISGGIPVHRLFIERWGTINFGVLPCFHHISSQQSTESQSLHHLEDFPSAETFFAQLPESGSLIGRSPCCGFPIWDLQGFTSSVSLLVVRPWIPRSLHNRIARFLENQGYQAEALQISKDIHSTPLIITWDLFIHGWVSTLTVNQV